MKTELETIADSLALLGVYPQLNRSSIGWDCTLWCGVDWKGSMPIGHGATAMAAMAAAVVDRNEILARRKAG